MSFGTGNKVPRGYQTGQLQQFTPEQMNLFQNMFGQVGQGSYLNRLASGDQSLFEEMEAPAHRQFQGQLGNIASRFSGMGMGGRHSSGFQNTATQAASDFSQELASKRQGLQRQAIMDLMGLSENLLNQRPYDRFMTEKKPSYWKQLLNNILGYAGEKGSQAADKYMTGKGWI